MDMFVLAAVAILAAMAGFWAGRSIQWQLAEAVETGAEEHVMILAQPSGNQRTTAGNGAVERSVAESSGQGAAQYAMQETETYMGQNINLTGRTEGVGIGRQTDIYAGGNAEAYAGRNADIRAGQYGGPYAEAHAGRNADIRAGQYGGPYAEAYAGQGADTDDLRNRRGFGRTGERSHDRASAKKNARFDRRRQVKTVSLGREIGSPVAGQMGVYMEDGRRKLRLLPDQGKVYAPASGRIQRLYPMGSAMLLHTEFGADLLLQAGSGVDEMCSGFYHCRVMEHEYVRKGTLLLEYDPAGIRGEGASPEVILSVENEEDLGGVTVTGQARVKVGETILYIACGRHSESYEKLS